MEKVYDMNELYELLQRRVERLGEELDSRAPDIVKLNELRLIKDAVDKMCEVAGV